MGKANLAIDAGLTGPRAALAAHHRIIGDLQRRVAELAAPNERLAGLLDLETAAEAALAAVGKAEASDLRRWLDHGGQQPKPLTERREAAAQRFEAARRAANVARQAEADRIASVERVHRALADATTERQAIITEILRTEEVPAVIRAYRDRYLSFMASYAALFAAVNALAARGVVIVNNARDWPTMIPAPTPDDRLGVEPEPWDVMAIHDKAKVALSALAEGLATNANATLADYTS